MNSPPKETGALLHAPISKLAVRNYHSQAATQGCGHTGIAVEERKLTAFRLARLAMCPRLNKWEQHFIESVSRRQRLTHRQQAIVDRLVATYLEVGK